MTYSCQFNDEQCKPQIERLDEHSHLAFLYGRRVHPAWLQPCLAVALVHQLRILQAILERTRWHHPVSHRPNEANRRADVTWAGGSHLLTRASKHARTQRPSTAATVRCAVRGWNRPERHGTGGTTATASAESLTSLTSHRFSIVPCPPSFTTSEPSLPSIDAYSKRSVPSLPWHSMKNWQFAPSVSGSA